MIHLSGYDLLWLFFIYSFAGWVLETVVATLRHHKFSNRGLVNGPLCILYGVTTCVMSVVLQELTGVWLFLFSTLYVAVSEFIAGHLIEKIYHEKWWDYSNFKWNLDGYICLSVSLAKGALGYLAVGFGNQFFLNLLGLLPQLLVHIVLLALIATLAVDVLASYILLTGKSKHPEKWGMANNRIDSIRVRLGNKIISQIENRLEKAYPEVQRVEQDGKDKTVFAKGCDFYKIVILFFVGAFLGDIIETIFCRITMGFWMSRSSVVWGPFSIVWGLAIAVATLLLYRYKDRNDGFLFCVGTFLGGAYEYLCSVFTEIVFGKIFWDYSGMPFNLGGRINLLYCFFWGIAAVIWFKRLYPVISGWIERIPVLIGKIATWAFIIFMCCNVIVTCMALIRYDERGRNVKAESSWQILMDEYYDDAKMEKRYPNAKSTGSVEKTGAITVKDFFIRMDKSCNYLGIFL